MKPKKKTLSPEEALKKAVTDLENQETENETDTEVENEQEGEEQSPGETNLLKALVNGLNKLVKSTPEKESEEEESEEEEESDEIEKAQSDDDGEEEEEEEEEKPAPKKPAFFNKKGAKKVKKSIADESEEDESEGEEEVADVTEFVEGMHGQMVDLQKSVTQLQEGMTAIADVVSEIASNKKQAEAISTISKALLHVVKTTEELKKAIGTPKTEVPVVPASKVVRGNKITKSETAAPAAMTEEDKNRLFKAATNGQITTSEMKKAIAENDQTIFAKIK